MEFKSESQLRDESIENNQSLLQNTGWSLFLKFEGIIGFVDGFNVDTTTTYEL